MQERTIAIDSDGNSITLRYDDRGFLVGDALDLGKTQKELESISGDVLAIRAFLMGSASRNRTESTDTVSPSINGARTSEKAAKKLLEAAKKLSRAADEVGNGSTRQSSERIASENRERDRNRRESARRQSQERTPPPIQSDGNERIPPTRAASERRATEAAGDLARAATEANERERRTRRARPSEANGNNGAGGRDANGRFLPGGRGANSIADSIKDGVGNGLKGISAEIANADINRVDPAIEATKEALAPVAMIAKPLGRASLAVGRIGLKGAVGTAKLLGRGFSSRGTDNWLKRLWNESRLGRRDSNLWNERRLRELRNRRGEGDGKGGLLGLLAMLLPLFAGFIAVLTGLFSKFFSATGLAGLLGKILPGALARRIAGGLGGGRDRGSNGGDDGRDSRRRRDRNPPTGDNGANPPIPPGGDNGRRRGGRFRGMRGLGWLAAGAALFGAASVEADDSLTREEKNQEHGASAGAVANGAAGAMAGAAIGTMIFPGVGTVVGGIIGGFAADYFAGDAAADLGARFAAWVSTTPLSAMPGQIVDKFAGWTDELKNSAVGQAVIAKAGEWTQELKDSKIGEYITGAWNSLTKGIESTWNSFSKTLGETWDKLGAGATKYLEGANNWIKEKTGIDVKGGIDAAGAAISSGAAAAGDAASSAWDATKGAATSAGDYMSGFREADSKSPQPKITKLLSTEGEKTRVYLREDGSIEKRTGGFASWRNNNPGNLKFEHAGSADKTVKSKRTKEKALKDAQARYDGIVDLDQFGNAVFESVEAGRSAKVKLLTGMHGGKTIEEMLPHYAKDDYTGKANHAAYAKRIHEVAAQRGVDLHGKKIGDLNKAEIDALAAGMGNMEGWKEGDVKIKDSPANPVGAMASAASAGMGMYDLAKTGYDKISGMVGKSTASSEKLTPDQIKELSGIINYTGNTPLAEGIGGLAGQSQQDFYAMAKEYQSKTSNKLNVGSAFRSAKEQERIAVEAKAKGIRAAEPGKSEHQHGYALDIDKQGASSPQVAELEKMGLLKKYNFSPDAAQRAGSRNKAGEAWHIEHDTSTYDTADATTKAQIVAMSKGGMDGYAIDKLVRSGVVGAIAKSAATPAASGGYYDYGYVAPTATSTVKTPSVPAMPPPPPPPKIAAPPEPPKQSPVSSQHATTLTGMIGEVGRDVSDRTIAHIVTGGIGQRN